MLNQSTMSRNFDLFSKGAGALILVFCLSSATRAGQEQQQEQQRGQDQTQQQDGAQASEPKPKYASQDEDKPPYSKDRAARRNASDGAAGVMRHAPAEPAQTEPAVPGRPADGAVAPVSLTVPAGTVLLVRINEFLSSDRNQVGDQFTGELEQPIVVNGWVVARRGQLVTGQVKAAQKAGRVKGVSQLGVELTDLTIVDGRKAPILTELWKGSGGTSEGQDAATIAGGTGFGALIGAAAGWGKGAAIGAGAGAAAGIATVLLTRGRPTILEPETQLNFRLVDPVTIDTTQGQQAFLPVTQRDYENGRFERRGPRRYVGGYPGGGYPCGYYGPCYAYPGYVGIYGEYYGRRWGRW
jgi:hypothetical protein